MSGEAEREKDTAALRLSGLAVLAANAGLGVTALNFAASSGAATLQALGIQGILAACALGFWLHALRKQGQAQNSETVGGSTSRDLLFWALVVPVLLYAFGAGIALIAGTQRLGVPAPLDAALVATSPLVQTVLLTAVALMAAALWSLLKTPTQKSQPSPTATQQEQGPRLALTVATAAGLVAAMVAAAAYLSWLDGNPDADAYGAAFIALVMAAVAARFSLEIRDALRATSRKVATTGTSLIDLASPIALETKAMKPAPDVREPSLTAGAPNPPVPPHPTNQPTGQPTSRPATSPGQKPPVVARQPGKRGRKHR